MNVMSCNRCGNPVNAVSAFCPHCGQPLRQSAPQATAVANATLGATALQQAYDTQKKRNLIIAAIVGVIALIVLIFFGLKASGALGISGTNPQSKLLSSNGSLGGPVMSKLGNLTPPVMEQNAQKPPDVQMPDDVYNWLKHLEKCEAMKVEIAGDQAADVQLWMQKFQVLGPGMSMMDPYDQSSDNPEDKAPGSYASGKIKDMRPKWDELLTFFRSVPPPQECVPIADDFDRAIREIPGMMGDLSDVLNAADTDPNDAMKRVKKMQNGSYGDIDRYFDRCDQKVGAICMKYKTNKWFNIKGDVVAGGMMGKFSSLGF